MLGDLPVPVLMRGVERLLIVIAAGLFGWLGYRLFQTGIDKGQAKFATESKLMKLTMSGTGPGLLFMAFGAITLIVALLTGGAASTLDGGEATKPPLGDARTTPTSTTAGGFVQPGKITVGSGLRSSDVLQYKNPLEEEAALKARMDAAKRDLQSSGSMTDGFPATVPAAMPTHP